MWQVWIAMVMSMLLRVAANIENAPTNSTISARVDSMLASMTIDDMLGQMTQLDLSTILNKDRTLNLDIVRQHARLKIGSYLNTPTFSEEEATPSGSTMVSAATEAMHGFSASEWRDVIAEIQKIFMNEPGGHPVLYGLDSVHGANYVRGATIFGQQINAAATFNPELVYAMGAITGRDTEAAGIPWVFGPILEVSQNPLWSRTYETFGEDPYLVAVMADAIVRGLQSNNQTAACMKHIIAYSKTETGHDRDPVTISDFELLNRFAPPFLAAIAAGAKTAMESYISVNGVPVVGSAKILDGLVRHDMAFDGLIVSDWGEIYNLHDWHHVAKNRDDAVRIVLSKTSLDLSMVPYDTTFIAQAKAVVEHERKLHERVKASVRRMLTLKAELGLYEHPLPGADKVHRVGDEEGRLAALTLARESVILLKNDRNVLPIKKSSRVLLTGPSAANIGNLCGGWTATWQGVSGNDIFSSGISIKDGFEGLACPQGSVSFFNGLQINGSCTEADKDRAVKLAARADYTVIALGEGPYAEKPGDINDLALPRGQVEYVRAIASTGTSVIVVIIGGRPRLLGELPGLADAVVYAMLPGELGGQVIAEIIYGDVNPSARLPITYPKDPASVGIPYNHPVSRQCGGGGCAVEWAFGHGLSYTNFAYSSVTLDKTQTSGKDGDDIVVSVCVTNTGERAGQETVMLFLTQPFREIAVPEVKQLKRFSKVGLRPNETKTVTFTLTRADWGVFDPQIGNGFNRVVEDGDFIVSIKPETRCTMGSIGALCATFQVRSW